MLAGHGPALTDLQKLPYAEMSFGGPFASILRRPYLRESLYRGRHYRGISRAQGQPGHRQHMRSLP